jgi:DNA-binding FadR family transcriptional regulator
MLSAIDLQLYQTQGLNCMTFGTSKKSVLSEEIVAQLLFLIKEKKLRPGDKLPPERELAAQMQVSRPSLREALRALSIMNIIEIRHGGGTQVTTLEPEQLLEHLEFVFALDNSTALELIEARKILEPGVIALVAERIAAETITALEIDLIEMAAVLDQSEAFAAAEFNLHQRLIKTVNNPILGRVALSLSCLSQSSRPPTGQSRADRQQSLAAYQTIVTALKLRDPETAQLVMYRHLVQLEKSLKLLTGSPKLSAPNCHPLKLTLQKSKDMVSAQERIFTFHQLMAQEHQYFYTTNIVAWKHFWLDAKGGVA